jgi:glycosyltransferase involved in cell wall biosynthesis
MHDKISIITVVYNDVEHIEKTIKSVISQNYPNIEYLIIDGNSSDGTLEKCKKYSERISKIVSEHDTGIYNAMNKGIKLATGEWLFFLNSGDVFCDENVISNVFKNENNADIIYGKAITPDGKLCYYPQKITKTMFIMERMICHQAIFARKKTFFDNLFDEGYRIIADRVWLYKCLCAKKVVEKKNIIVSIYDTNGISSNKEKFDKESLRFLKEISRKFYYFGLLKRFFKNLIKKN